MKLNIKVVYTRNGNDYDDEINSQDKSLPGPALSLLWPSPYQALATRLGGPKWRPENVQSEGSARIYLQATNSICRGCQWSRFPSEQLVAYFCSASLLLISVANDVQQQPRRPLECPTSPLKFPCHSHQRPLPLVRLILSIAQRLCRLFALS